MTVEDVLSQVNHDLFTARDRCNPVSPPTLIERIRACKKLKAVMLLIDEELEFLHHRLARLKNGQDLCLLIKRSEEEQQILREARNQIEEAITVPEHTTVFRVDGSGDVLAEIMK